MNRLFASFVLLASVQMLFAESNAPSPVGPANYGKPLNPGSIQVFDDKFFENKPAPPPPAGNAGRYVGEEPDYNTEQRAQWLSKCSEFKDRDGEKYRKCYQEEKTKTQQALKQGYEQVERRQQEPLRNTNPLLEEQQRSYQQSDD